MQTKKNARNQRRRGPDHSHPHSTSLPACSDLAPRFRLVEDHLVICEKGSPTGWVLDPSSTAGKTSVFGHRPWNQRSLRIGAGSATAAVLHEKIFKKIGIQLPRGVSSFLILMAILDHFRVFIRSMPMSMRSFGNLNCTEFSSQTGDNVDAWDTSTRCVGVAGGLLSWDGKGQTCL